MAFFIKDGSRCELIDTGAGEQFEPGLGAKLAAIGYRPDQVDVVLINHEHSDHSGGAW